MTGSELSDIYQSKAIEYLIAVAYLVLFVPFWRYVQAGPTPERVAARVPLRVPVRVPVADGWFAVPPHVALHPGHAWAAPAGPAVLVGMDDFARRLIGPMKGVRLPRAGDVLRQGETGWTVLADGKALDMVSPVDGVVVDVNQAAALQPESVMDDPYGRGWLLKVRPTQWTRSARQLLAGSAARRLLEDAGDRLRAHVTPDLGLVLQDGGRPIQGVARELAPESWDELARTFLLT